MFKLVIADDEGKTTVVPLVRDEITIGRKEGNTIRLTERNVSRRHARLHRANGKFVVEDLQSYNGVSVNGERIAAETTLEAGDQIVIGDYQIALQLDGGTERVSSAPPPPPSTDVGPAPRLVMITPPAPGAEFPLSQARTRLGRAEDLDIWVNHRSISREHAEVQRDGERFNLIDLGSANGVRVNGQDVQSKVLETGDVIELGQVRLRFVASGDAYTFDAASTLQVDAITPPTSPTRVPLIVAAIIIGLGLIGAAVVAFGGFSSSDDTVARPLDGDGSYSGSPERFNTELSACTRALENNSIAQAMTHAEAALGLRPDDPAARRCRDQAQSMQVAEETFNRGVRHLRGGALEEAYFAFEELPPTSSLRNRPQVRDAAQGYADAQLRAATDFLERDADEALRIAQFVRAMNLITPAQRAQAAALVSDAQNRGGTGTGPPSPRPSPPRPNPDPRDPRSGRPPRPRPPRPRPTDPPSEPESTGPSRSQRASECAIDGDQECVIRLLGGGRARSQQDMQVLEGAYTQLRRTSAAHAVMRQYLERYPGGPAAARYRRTLSTQQ